MELQILINILTFTGMQAFMSTAISCIGGLFLARYIFAYPKGWYESLLSLPLVMPSISVVLGYCALAGDEHIFSLFGLTGILICHVFLNLPLATLMILKGYQTTPSSLWHLSTTLRLPSTFHLYKIELPLLKKALLRTAALIFLFCFSSFTIPLMMGGGPDGSTLSVLLYYNLVIQGNYTATLYLLGLNISICALVICLSSISKEKPFKAYQPACRILPNALKSAAKAKGLLMLAMLLLFLPPIFGLLVHLLHDLPFLKWPVGLGKALQGSVIVASTSAIMVLLLACLILLAFPRQRHWLERITYIVLAFPSFIIGVIIFWFSLAGWGTIMHAYPALVLTNTVVGLPIALKVLNPTISKIDMNYGMLQTNLRLTRWARLRWLYIPLLMPSLKLAFALVMAYSLGDLGSILLFNQDEIQTLPGLIYEAYGRFDLVEARLLSVILMGLVGLIFLILKIRPHKYA